MDLCTATLPDHYVDEVDRDPLPLPCQLPAGHPGRHRLTDALDAVTRW